MRSFFTTGLFCLNYGERKRKFERVSGLFACVWRDGKME
jgi:hypothetical protein